MGLGANAVAKGSKELQLEGNRNGNTKIPRLKYSEALCQARAAFCCFPILKVASVLNV